MYIRYAKFRTTYVAEDTAVGSREASPWLAGQAISRSA